MTEVSQEAREAAEDTCLHCGKTEWQHMKVLGAGRICPVSAFTFSSRRAFQSTITARVRAETIEECAKLADREAYCQRVKRTKSQDDEAIIAVGYVANAIRALGEQP